MPSLTCPPPVSTGPDCPLYEQRVALSPGEALRRAILTEHPKAPDLAALLRTEDHPVRTPQAALPPGREPAAITLNKLLEEAK
jgi:hypothetical protein